MTGGVREEWGGADWVREEEEDERSCCCWESLGSLHLLSSAPTITSPPPPSPPIFCLLTFQGMQPSSWRPPRPFPFHSSDKYSALPIPGCSPAPPRPLRPPPPSPPLPPQLLPSGRYIHIMTTITIATSQLLGGEEVLRLGVGTRRRWGLRGVWDLWPFGTNTPALWRTAVKRTRGRWGQTGGADGFGQKKIKDTKKKQQHQWCQQSLCVSTSSIITACWRFLPFSHQDYTALHFFPSADRRPSRPFCHWNRHRSCHSSSSSRMLTLRKKQQQRQAFHFGRSSITHSNKQTKTQPLHRDTQNQKRWRWFIVFTIH